MSKKIKLKNQRINRNDLIIKIASFIIILLVITLIILLSIEIGIFKKIFLQEEHVLIKGECYVLFDNIFYQISDENTCRNECINECWVREKDFSKSQFVPTPESCNLCNCYCK